MSTYYRHKVALELQSKNYAQTYSNSTKSAMGCYWQNLTHKTNWPMIWWLMILIGSLKFLHLQKWWFCSLHNVIIKHYGARLIFPMNVYQTNSSNQTINQLLSLLTSIESQKLLNSKLYISNATLQSINKWSPLLVALMHTAPPSKVNPF